MHRRVAPLSCWLPRLASLLVLAWTLASLGQGSGVPAVPASRQASNVAIIEIHGTIDETTFQSVRRRLAIAERAGADAVVFELNTPGGELGAVLAICTAIKASPIRNTVAWVHHDAYSGGAVIALACREIVAADPATLGDALVVSGNPLFTFSQMPEHERQKIMAPLISELVDSARRHGYDEMLVQGIATRGVELWLVEHVQTGRRLFVTRSEYRTIFGEEPAAGVPVLASAPAEDGGAGPSRSPGSGEAPAGVPAPAPAPTTPLTDDPAARFIPASPHLHPLASDIAQRQELRPVRPVITTADRGRWRLIEYVSSGSGPLVFKTAELQRYGLAAAVINSDEELKAFFGARHMIRLRPTWSEGLVAFLTSLPVRGLLVVLFLLGLFLEMTHPGLSLPGAVAVLALAGLVAPPMIINMANWWTIAAILGGVLLVAVEIFVLPGFGIAGVAGLVLLFAGLVGTLVPTRSLFPDTPQQRSELLYGVATLVLALVSTGVLMFLIGRYLRVIPLMNRLVLRDQVPDEEESGAQLFQAAAPALRVGMTGLALTPLRPAGRVQIGDQIVDVVSDVGYIPAGTTVRVVSVSEFRVVVEPATG